jgi:glutathione S-transferase
MLAIQTMARFLYHFPTSVFSRRTRLALAHKGFTSDDVELRDARTDEAHLREAHRLSPLKTMPVFVDEGGYALSDSTSIAQYLDLAYPDRPLLFPSGGNGNREAAHATLAITTAIDVAMNTLVDMGTRNWELRKDAAWESVLRERIARAQGAIDFVAARASKPLLTAAATWGAAEIWTLSATLWVAGMPARAKTAPLVAQILTLGFRLPEALVTWSKLHESRPDVHSIYFS